MTVDERDESEIDDSWTAEAATEPEAGWSDEQTMSQMDPVHIQSPDLFIPFNFIRNKPYIDLVHNAPLRSCPRHINPFFPERFQLTNTVAQVRFSSADKTNSLWTKASAKWWNVKERLVKHDEIWKFKVHLRGGRHSQSH